MQPMPIRQGDVYLVPERLAQQINERFRIRAVATDPDGRHILAYGEVSGHYHAINGASVVEASGGLVLDVGEGAELTHLGYEGPREHDRIQVLPGRYVPVQQHEYDIVQGWRAVVD